ncbi:hypothetical protein KK062_08085 [Fulvivirgaceae bacterium PWU5]|uniref:Uncharacterized protein n=1 Tax=Dawidia cretensis TaxID=2782350 RepID=A0AAP2GTF9_9BACT|nr:hypothetical protein [Dawidia cretensis]MBT1708178.1 hypothetical protein [Dawidia cretensis]
MPGQKVQDGAFVSRGVLAVHASTDVIEKVGVNGGVPGKDATPAALS